MNVMLRFKTSLLFLFFFQQFTIAQQFHYTNYRIGLPSSKVYDILQDKKGYIWFATDRGVARYNGKEFKAYTTSDGLLDNTVFSMGEDSKGRIWFASQSNEFCYWFEDSIYRPPGLQGLHSALTSNNYIHTLYADSTDNLWFGSKQHLFFCEAKKNYAFKKLPIDTASSYEIQLIDGSKAILVSGNTGKINERSSKKNPLNLVINCYQNNTVSKRYAFPIYADEATAPFLTVACEYSKKTNTHLFALDSLLLIIGNNKTERKRMGHSIINIISDRNQDVWICFDKGGVAFFKDGDFNKDPITFLEDITVNDVTVDHEDGVWIATLEKGVFYVPSTSILTYPNIPRLNKPTYFIGELDKKVTIITNGSLISEATGMHISTVDALKKQTENKGHLFCVKKIRDTLYVSSENELIRFAPQLLPQKNKNHHTPLSPGKSILETTDHQVWLQTGSSLRSINRQRFNDIDYPAPFIVTTAVPQGNTILVGGKKGLYLFKDQQYTSMSSVDPLLKNPIIEMARDREGTLWIATIGKGVLRLKNNHVQKITEENGLISTICTCLSIDVYGNIWIGTNKGISCIQNPGSEHAQWRIKNIDEKTGLNSDDITKLFASGNFVWVGTMSGISRIDIKSILCPVQPPLIYIDSIKNNGSSVKALGNVFSYKQNNILFKLHGLTFKDKGKHYFRYWLADLNTSWQPLKTDELLINNLPPGKFEFRVQVANSDKIWSKTATYAFTINKPFWLTWWFIAGEALVLILIVSLIILWRTTIIRKKEQEKLRINKLLAEYQMKALTAQMNPHFIFNAINSIQNFIIQNHSTLAYDYLIKFSKLIRLVLNNSQDNEVTLQQELETLALYIELEQLRFERSFEYHLKIDPRVDTESLMIPGLLLQPYIENAIWHGLMPLKTRKGIISLFIMQEQELLKITITDNGVGRKASDLIKKKIVHKGHQSVGMELTGKRIELFGQDSKFSLQIIDNYDEQENATGTTVEIVLPMIEMY